MVVVDVGELTETSSLEQVVDLGELGLVPMVQPLLTYALDMMVWHHLIVVTELWSSSRGG
jgi:hypothetical protein